MPFSHKLDDNKIKEFYLAGHTLKTIAKQFNCSPNTILRNLQKNNVSTRKRGEYFTKNFDNQKFGRLTVIRRSETHDKHGRPLLLCKCECGAERKIAVSNLMQMKHPTCGHRTCKRGPSGVHWNGYKEISQTIYQRIKAGATNRDIEFKITIEDMYRQWKKQKGICSLSGRTLTVYESSAYTYTCSLDRIDSARGYYKNNIQWIHKDINKMKMDLKQDDFISLCKEIAEYNQ